jgi:hypothetical protein
MIRFQLLDDPVDAANYSRPEYWGECLAEEASMTNASADMPSPGGFGRLGSLSLVVIRRVSSCCHEQKEAQERLARLSTDSVLLVAHKSGHK